MITSPWDSGIFQWLERVAQDRKIWSSSPSHAEGSDSENELPTYILSPTTPISLRRARQ